MAKASPAQTAFTTGEVSPLLLAREDLANFSKGLATCLNSYPLVQGAWSRRPGSLFLKTTKFGGAKESILLPFNFSVDQAYVLEFGDVYVRFFTLQGILTNTAQNIEDITQADPAVMTITGHGYSDGDRLHLDGGIGGTHQLRYREVIVANQTANTFELTDIYGVDIDSSGYGAYTSGGTVGEPLEVVTPYLEADLPLIKVTQTADTLYILHPGYETRVLTRQSATSWTLAKAAFTDGPYDAVNTETTTLTPSATTGTITITASAVTGINEGLGFQAGDVDRLVRLEHSSTWGYAKITVVGTTTSVTATVVETLGGTTATTEWRLGLFSETTGWPSCGTFYEDRLWVGGADVFSQDLSGSRTGRYVNFKPTDADGLVADDHAIQYTLNASDVNDLLWLSDNEKALLAGTSGGEWPVRPSQVSEALTPSNISAKRATRHGSADIAPVESGYSTLFIQRSRTKLREITYEDALDGFQAPDVSLLSEHIPRPALVGATYQKNPQSIVFAWRSDGVVAGFTYERDAGVYAWHRHILGGVGDAAGGAPEVESMATIPTSNGRWDETYIIAKRYINGTTERYVELLTKSWEKGDEAEDAFFVDCGVTEVFGSPDDEVLGLWHLEGEEVIILLDGAISSPRTVTNGKVDLDVAGSIVTLGYSYNSDGELLPFVAGARDGSALTKESTVHLVGFWLMDSLGIKVGPSEDELTEILVRNWGGLWGNATPLFTGALRESFEGDYERAVQVYFRADGPFPANILAVTQQGDTEDDS